MIIFIVGMVVGLVVGAVIAWGNQFGGMAASKTIKNELDAARWRELQKKKSAPAMPPVELNRTLP